MSDFFSNELSVHIRLLYFDNINKHLLIHHLFELSSELFNFCTASADNNTRLCTVNVDSNLISKSFNLYLRNTCINAFVSRILGPSVKNFHDILTYIIVLYERIAESTLICKPARIPIFNNADTKTVRPP